ncbi:SH3 domain-containing protein [Clostridium sp. AL.422]|uniref:SH3 domain-containing protein n=1 Tax=Clostridium TaxID=1485 RepID=UPI00293DE758|nr:MULTISPECIES: SH3 domain-containing protein [unclassified Clostridium]MDV4150317.1 SH3 domain-containing protein [Clostridium sp. AL.422]
MIHLAKYLASIYIFTSTVFPVQLISSTKTYAMDNIKSAQIELSSESQTPINNMSRLAVVERYFIEYKQQILEEEQKLKTEHQRYGQVIYDDSRLRAEPNTNSEIKFVFKKGMTFEIIERQWDWLKVNYNGEEGFIYMPLVEQYEDKPPYEVYKEPTGIPHYNPNNLRELSNLTEDQIYKMLEGSALQTLSSAYYYYEKEYNVNAIFLMSLNSEESGHGRSSLARTHNNLGGVKDGNSWRYFNDWGESLDYITRLIDKYYLTEGGDYYNGVSVWNVNVRYCEGNTWAGNLNTIANELLAKL